MQFRNWMKKIEERRRKGWLKRRQLIVCNNTLHIDDIHVKLYNTYRLFEKFTIIPCGIKFWHFHGKKIFRWKRNKIKNKIDITMKVLPISQNMKDDSFLIPYTKTDLLYFSILLNRSLSTRSETICNFETLGRIYDSLELALRFNTVGA